MSSPRTKRLVASILESPNFAVAFAFTLRIILLWLSHYHEDRSNPRFETVGLEARLLAFSLAQGRGLFGPYPGYQAITACVAPVYPFLWAIGIKLFHLGDFGATVFAQAMNCTFSAATCWPIFAIGKRLYGQKVGVASAWLWGFLPYAVLLPLEWTWDQSLDALMLASIVQATFALRESDSSVSWTGYGLLWAFAVLTNPTLGLLLPFILGWLLVRKTPDGGHKLALGARTVAVFALALLPWTIRNYYAIDGLVFVKSNFGMELWLGNNPAVTKINSPELHPMNNLSQRILLILAGEPNYNRVRQRQAVAYIEEHPRTFLKNFSDRVADTWSADYDSTVEPWIFNQHFAPEDVWFCIAFSALALTGLVLALAANWWDSVPLALCILIFPVPYYLTRSSLRFRHPIDPFLSIFAVYAVTRLLAIFMRHPGHEPPGAPPVTNSNRSCNNQEDILAHQS